MSRTKEEAIAFIEETRFALEHLFNALEQRRRARDELRVNIESLEETKRLLHAQFVETDQYSDDANWHYAKLIERLDSLEAKRRELTSERSEEDRLRDLLARFGATEQAMAVLAGSVLQLAKQALSFRYGSSKNSIPPGPLVGSQPARDVIWEGRNHSMHWEEGMGRPPLENMLRLLQADSLALIIHGENNSLAILDALRWTSVDSVVHTLRALLETS